MIASFLWRMAFGWAFGSGLRLTTYEAGITRFIAEGRPSECAPTLTTLMAHDHDDVVRSWQGDGAARTHQPRANGHDERIVRRGNAGKQKRTNGAHKID